MTGPVLARPTVELLGDDSSLAAAVARAEGALNRAGERMQRVGAALSVGLSLPILAIGTAATKAAIKFESSFAGIRKTMDLTEDQFGQLAAANRQLAKEIPVAVDELNRIGELAGQLGIRGVQNVLKFEDTIAKLAVTTDLTAEQGALAFAQIANVMQLPQDQIDRLGAAVVGLGNNFATVESQIVEFTSRIAGAGKIAGVSAGSVAGIGAAFASLGVNAEAGGTAVQKVLISMVTAVATGNADLSAFAATLGVTGDAFKSAFREDASGTFVRFVEALGTQGERAITTLEALGLTDQRLTRSFLAAAGAGDLLRRAVERGNAEFAKNTALNDEAAKRFKTTESQLTLLRNRFHDVAITVGQALAPMLLSLITLTSPLVGAIEVLAAAFLTAPAPVRVLAVALGVLAAAAGPTLLALGALVKLAPVITAGYLKAGLAASGFTAAMTTQRSVALTLIAVKNALAASLLRVRTATIAGVVPAMARWLALAQVVRPTTLALAVANAAWARSMVVARAAAASMIPILTIATAAGIFFVKNWDVLKHKFVLAWEAMRQAAFGAVDALLGVVEKLVGRIPIVGEQVRNLRKEFGEFSERELAKAGDRLAKSELALSAAGQGADDLGRLLRDAANGVAGFNNAASGTPGAVDPAARSIKEITTELHAALKANQQLEELLGDQFDLPAANAQLYRQAIEDLIGAGAKLNTVVGPQKETLAQVAAIYIALQNGIDGAARSTASMAFWQGEVNKVFEAGRQITQDMLTPQELLRQKLGELDALLEASAITWETYSRAVAQAKKEFADATEKLSPLKAGLAAVAASGIDAFAAFATGAGNAIRDFVQQALRDLARLALRFAAFKVLSSFFPGSGTIIEAITGFQARAMGGPVQSGRPYLVGERGPELFVPHSAGRIHANASGGGGGTSASKTAASILAALPPIPGPLPPEVAATHDWYRRLLGAMAKDGIARGVRFA